MLQSQVSKLLRTSLLLAAAAMGSMAAGCASSARLPVAAGTGPDPTLPPPNRALIPTVHVVTAKGWPEGAKPVAAAGTAVAPFARDLDHPRWLHVLPNGDVLVAETNAPPRPADNKGIKGFFFKKFQKKAGGAVPSADRITLLRDADGDGVAETRTAFLTGLHSPFGMALVGDTLYVANTDAVVKFTYTEGATQITAPAVKVADLPGGLRNHHWTKSLIASPDGGKLYVGVGSNSNVAEHGMAEEEGRAAIWEIDPATGASRVFAAGLRNPVGMAWEPETGALWTAVNERDELGSDLVPDYMTSVRDGGFYGWPYSYFGRHVDTRVKPPPAGPGGQGPGPRLRPRPPHRLPGARPFAGHHPPRALPHRHVRGPARLLEPQAEERLQGDLRPLRGGQADGRADRRADRLRRRTGQRHGAAGGGGDRQERRPADGRRRGQRGLAGDGGGGRAGGPVRAPAIAPSR